MKLLKFKVQTDKYWRSLLLLILALAVLFFNDIQPIRMIRQMVNHVTQPVSASLSAVSSSIQDAKTALGEYVGLKEKYDAKLAESELLRDNLALLQQLYYENRELREVLRFSFPGLKTIATTRVISKFEGSYIDHAAIMIGSEAGLTEGQVVVNGDGVIGRLVDVGYHHAQILLLSDPQSKTPIFFPRTKEHAVAVGDHQGLLVRYLPKASDVQVGDLVVTSGEGSIYPYGLLIGKVSQVTAGSVKLEPSYDQGKLSLVTILSYER